MQWDRFLLHPNLFVKETVDWSFKICSGCTALKWCRRLTPLRYRFPYQLGVNACMGPVHQHCHESRIMLVGSHDRSWYLLETALQTIELNIDAITSTPYGGVCVFYEGEYCFISSIRLAINEKKPRGIGSLIKK